MYVALHFCLTKLSPGFFLSGYRKRKANNTHMMMTCAAGSVPFLLARPVKRKPIALYRRALGSKFSACE